MALNYPAMDATGDALDGTLMLLSAHLAKGRDRRQWRRCLAQHADAAAARADAAGVAREFICLPLGERVAAAHDDAVAAVVFSLPRE